MRAKHGKVPGLGPLAGDSPVSWNIINLLFESSLPLALTSVRFSSNFLL